MLKFFSWARFILFKLNKSISRFFLQKLLKNKLDGCHIYGTPLLELFSIESLEIGRGVTINSKNLYYHTSMHSKCKFIANNKNSKIIIGDNTRIHGSCLHAKERITVGKNVLIAGNCQIIDNNGHSLYQTNLLDRINTKSKSKPIVIEDGVWIGIGSIILPGVTIGAGSVVSAGSVVNNNVPKNVLVAGNPAIIIKNLTQKK
jgi:acetyltransferase-like isoleucine patch superfamily enzyme